MFDILFGEFYKSKLFLVLLSILPTILFIYNTIVYKY